MVFKQKLEKFTRTIIPRVTQQKPTTNESVITYESPTWNRGKDNLKGRNNKKSCLNRFKEASFLSDR